MRLSLVPGSIGIFTIGLVSGFYFARFLDAHKNLAPSAFVSVLAAIGIGPAAVVLVRAYQGLNLLDPYGIGLLFGVLINILLRLWDIRLYAREQAEISEIMTPEAVHRGPAQQAQRALKRTREMRLSRSFRQTLHAILSTREDLLPNDTGTQ